MYAKSDENYEWHAGHDISDDGHGEQIHKEEERYKQHSGQGLRGQLDETGRFWIQLI